MTEVVDQSISTPRLTGFLLGLFAFVALTLSAVGIYGVLSYVVSQRTHEIGIRMAVGASAGSVVGLVLRDGVALALAGIALGLAAAAALTGLMSALLYGVTPLDPATFVAVPVVLGVVALAASCVPGVARVAGGPAAGAQDAVGAAVALRASAGQGVGLEKVDGRDYFVIQSLSG